MSIDAVRAALLWCTAINYGLLLLWFLLVVGLREPVYRLWGRWFRLSAEQFDALNFGGIALYNLLSAGRLSNFRGFRWQVLRLAVSPDARSRGPGPADLWSPQSADSA